MYTGLYAQVLINPKFKTTLTLGVNNTAKTITATLKNDRGVPNQAADVSKKVELGRPEKMKLSALYTLFIEDTAGHALKRAKIDTRPSA